MISLMERTPRNAVTNLPMTCQSVLLRIFLVRLILVFKCLHSIVCGLIWGDKIEIWFVEIISVRIFIIFIVNDD